MTGWPTIEQSPHMRYMDYNITSSTIITGYFQNNNYIIDASDEIRSAFHLNERYMNHAIDTIQNIRNKFHNLSSPRLVGTHIRLGDILEPKFVEHGYVATNTSFYEQAMRIMAKKHGRDKSIFVVSSDTISGAKEMLAPLEGEYHIKYLDHNGTVLEDFSVLYNMDHMITSGGTFGFWAAWNVPGDVVYFSEYAKPGSSLRQTGYCQECLYFPTWIPVGNSLPSCPKQNID